MSRTIYIAVLTTLIILTASLLFTSCGRNEMPGPAELPAEPEEIDLVDSNNGSAVTENPVEEPVMPRIGIYSGKGSWDVNIITLQHFFDNYNIEWSELNEQDAVSLDLGTYFDIIWFPGGFAAEYKNFISDHSNIRSFVSEGGAFIGSCAGAYYAGDILRWHGTDHQYPLKLFDGRGIGPLVGLIAWGDIDTIYLDADHPVNAGFQNSLDMYYFDGPYFEPYNPDKIEVLARYAVNDKPAVIAGRYGSGKYMLFGPHPELGGYSVESPDFNLDGGEGAQWPWLHASLLWFSNW
ncbi:MAG: BPL-N domain-containing protein [Bacillota bacterium]